MSAPLNLCRSCGRDFTALRGFDAHRVGAYGPGEYRGSPEDWTSGQGRRCLTTDELQGKGYEQNERGRWFDPAEVSRGLSALHRSLQAPSGVTTCTTKPPHGTRSVDGTNQEVRPA